MVWTVPWVGLDGSLLLIEKLYAQKLKQATDFYVVIPDKPSTA